MQAIFIIRSIWSYSFWLYVSLIFELTLTEVITFIQIWDINKVKRMLIKRSRKSKQSYNNDKYNWFYQDNFFIKLSNDCLESCEP